MDYDFEYDYKKVTDVIIDMYHSYNELWDNCDNLYNEINNMNDSWAGDSYESFASGVKDYEPAVRGIPSILWAFREALIDARNDGTQLIKDIKSALDIF